jgi:hypothetical protein
MCSKVLPVFGLTTGYVDSLPYRPEGTIILFLMFLTPAFVSLFLVGRPLLD